MTPYDALTKFAELRVVPPGSDYLRSAVLDVLRAIAATATENETRRCTKLVGGGYLGNEILRSGGLKVEE